MYYLISGALNCISWITLGLIVFLSNARGTLIRSFAILSLSVTIYMFGYTLWQVENIYGEAEQALFWIRFGMLGVIVIPVAFFNFSIQFIGQKARYQSIQRLNYFLVILFLLFSFSPYYIVGVLPKLSFPYWPKGGILFYFQTLHFISITTFSHILVFKSLDRIEKVSKKWVGMLLFASLIGFSGGMTNYFLWYHIPIPPYGNISLTISVSILIYAIVRYRFLDIDIIIKRTLIFAGLVASAVLIFGLITYITNSWIGNMLGIGNDAVTIVSLVIVALSSAPIYHFLQDKTDRFLFQKKHDYQRILKDVARDMAKITDLDELFNIVSKFLIQKMQLKGAWMYLKDPNNAKFVLRAGKGDKPSTTVLFVKDPLIQMLNKHQSPLLKIPPQNSLNGPLENSTSSRWHIKLEELGCSVVVPSIGPEGLIAIFLLGDKQSGERYNQLDLDTLDALAHDAAIALENARLYDDLKKSFNELKTTKDQLVQSEKLAAVGQLAAGVAHEVNNPLAVIRGQAAMKLKEYQNVPEPLIRFMEEVISQTDRAAMITKKLLRFAKPKRGEIEALDPTKLLDESLKYAQQQTSTNHVKITRNYPNSSVTIQAHRQQIQEVFVNLILNAYQAMPEGGDLTLSVEPNSKSVCVSVQDTGAGISEDLQSKIFDPFFTTKKEGTGLGLFVSYKITQIYGGRIEVKTSHNKGTTFLVSLPGSKR